MKKKILLFAIIMAMLVCVFAISASADNIVKSSSDEFGELTTFDEAIGNTNISQLKDDGTIARTVLTDGNGNYYTIPTVYTLTEHHKNRGAGVEGEMFNLSFGEISTKLGFTVSKNSIIRIEFPSDIKFICSGNENLSGCANMVECIMNDGVYFWDNGQRKVFTNCKKLKSLDLSGMIIDQNQGTFSMLEYCEELEYVKLPNAYQNADGTYMDYATNYMFHGCKKLKTIENMEGFFKGDKTLNYRTFANCYVLEKIVLPYGLEKIEGRAIGACKAITEIIIPDTVTEIGTTETVFESCTSLKKVVLPKKVSLGSYCFEKCTGLTDVWMPQEASTFAKQVFGQCGGDLNVTFHFATANNVITVTNTEFNKDPYLSAINNKDGDSRLAFNTPLSTKCTIFLGGHKLDPVKSNPCAGVCGGCGEATLAENPAHSYVTTIVYENYLAKGVKTQVCRNEGCAHKTTPFVSDANPIITEFKGFSVSEKGDGITFGFAFDKDAIAEFEAIYGKIELGFVVAAKALLGENAPLNADGTVSTDKVVKASVLDEEAGYTGADFVLRGDWDRNVTIGEETVDIKNVEFYMAGYLAVNGTVSYLNYGASGNTADTITFAEANTPDANA